MASVKFPTFPSVDFSKLDLDKLPKFKVPQIKVTQFDMTDFKVPQFDMPKFDMEKLNTEAVTSAVKDAGYITVGLAVLAVQKAQVRRQELRKALTDQVGNSTSQLGELVDAVEARLAKADTRLIALEAKVDDAIDGFEKRLPARAGALVGQAHEVVKVARKQVRTLFTSAA